jgi:signal transduction histidine kinase
VKEETVLAYDAALCMLAIGLLVGLIHAPWERPAVTDLVVELGEERSGSLRDALARSLGDPTLEVGYPLPDGGGYVDASGRSLEVPRRGSDRGVTRLKRDGREVAVLLHDPAVLDDPALLGGIGAAARLAALNAGLQADVRAQVAEVQASRRRLLAAGDEERRRLEQRLDEGAARRLASLADVLARARSRAGVDGRARIERAQDQLERTRVDLRELAGGLHPRELVEDGLAAALVALAERSPIPVELTVPTQRLPTDVEAAVYFVCSEALANVAKYASAAHAVAAVVVRDGVVRVEVTDDGVGGADPAGGTGLRGLSDRIEALGGEFRITSSPEWGTRIAAELFLG